LLLSTPGGTHSAAAAEGDGQAFARDNPLAGQDGTARGVFASADHLGMAETACGDVYFLPFYAGEIETGKAVFD
jgi:hypothetical protein